jgi:nitrogen fixation/metabolism regulation signal transduction histidine kinase
MVQVNAARAHLQTILDNLTAGVIVLDEQGRILTANPGATRILRVPLAACEGRPLASVEGLEAFGAAVQQQFDDYLAERRQHGLDHWQQSFELGAVGAGVPQNVVTLVARGAEMPGEQPGRTARLLVFDDISEIVSAQRAQAWGEVARRLAHEIKNPLTPIQLSAERLEKKLAGKLAPPEQAVLTKSVHTIVEQVDAVAAELGVKPGQVALAWLLAQGDDIAPIPGTKRVAFLEENTAADAIELTPAHLAALDEVAAPAGDRYEDMSTINR